MKKTKKTKKKPSRKKTGWNISRQGILCFLIALFVLAADQISKYWVQANIPRMTYRTLWYPYNGIGVFDDFLGVEFSIVHAINRGAAWGIFSEYQDWLFAFRILFIAVIIIYAIWFNKTRELALPFTLVIAGAVGNIIDYFVYGHVVDMLHFVFWGFDYPVFNLADSAIFLGVCGILFHTIRNPNSKLLSKA